MVQNLRYLNLSAELKHSVYLPNSMKARWGKLLILINSSSQEFTEKHLLEPSSASGTQSAGGLFLDISSKLPSDNTGYQ